LPPVKEREPEKTARPKCADCGTAPAELNYLGNGWKKRCGRCQEIADRKKGYVRRKGAEADMSGEPTPQELIWRAVATETAAERDRLRAEVEELRNQREAWSREWLGWQERVESLRAEKAELVAVLKRATSLQRSRTKSNVSLTNGMGAIAR
jgi:uncharacterized coiled-coil DUF342 family protein